MLITLFHITKAYRSTISRIFEHYVPPEKNSRGISCILFPNNFGGGGRNGGKSITALVFNFLSNTENSNKRKNNAEFHSPHPGNHGQWSGEHPPLTCFLTRMQQTCRCLKWGHTQCSLHKHVLEHQAWM